ncbi:MAG: ABC transporter ATP-binding protein/permease [Thermoanaerobaculum sp.]|nr:ABC transporter ATP-binding protein/permease [Thermoanaerobaculum sp.]
MKVLLRLLRYTRPHIGWAAVAVVGMVGVALATVFLMYLVVPLFDNMLGAGAAQQILGKNVAGEGSGAGKKPLSPVVRGLQRQFERARAALASHLPSEGWALAALVLLTVFVKNALTYFGHYAFFRTGLATVKDLRDHLVDALLRQSPEYFQQQPTAVLMSRVTNDVEQITAALSDRFGDLFQDSFTVVGLLVYAFSLNFRFALAALVVAPLLIAPVWHFSRRLRKRSHQSQQRLGEMNTVLDEVFKGHKVVQAFGMERFEAARFRQATRRHFTANLKARKVQALNAPVMEVLGVGGAMALIGYASHLISRGEMTLGLFTSFLFALYCMYNPIKRLNKLNLALQMAIAAGERVFAVLDAPVAITDRPNARPFGQLRQGIRFSNVHFAYEPEKPVLRGFDLEIPAGKVVALVGPSGAGKSTVAQLLPRFWDVQQGCITADGVDIRDFTLASWRGAIGLVTQETVLFNTTIRANIAYGQEEVDEERLRACAQAAFAEEFILEFPDGYDTVVGEAGIKLSGGQRQRLAVARALYKNPPILILDEATSALDAEAEAVVQKALENLMRGRTTLVIAHRLATVRNADWIAVMDEGRVVEQGTHRQLLARSGLYAYLAELQGLTE